MPSKQQEPLFQGIRAAFLDESLEEMQYVFRDMGGRVLNLEKVDKDNYPSALKWCDYIILDEQINQQMDDRMLNKVAKRLSTPRDELLEIMRKGVEEQG